MCYQYVKKKSHPTKESDSNKEIKKRTSLEDELEWLSNTYNIPNVMDVGCWVLKLKQEFTRTEFRKIQRVGVQAHSRHAKRASSL